MATTRPLPRRVASPAFMTTPAHPPRPWPNLPAETQAQIAHVLAALLRRMPAAHMLTASNAPDERLSAAHRARLAYIYVASPRSIRSGLLARHALRVGAHEQGRRGLCDLLPVRPHESIASRKRGQSLGAWTWLL